MRGLSAYPCSVVQGCVVGTYNTTYVCSSLHIEQIDNPSYNFLLPSSCFSLLHWNAENMASITASAAISSVACTALLPRGSAIGSPPALGLPVMAKMGKVRCSVERKSEAQASDSKLGMGASLLAAACAATMSSPAMALVDERMSTEGTGLPFGLSNNLLGWILFGVFGLIWALYIVYTGSLDEDEESGLSL